MPMEREIAEILLGIKAVTLRASPPFRWASGIVAPIYVDNRMLMSYPAERKTIVVWMSRLTHNMGLKPDVIAGVATSGIPWAAWVAADLGKPMIYVRPDAKDHGKGNLIEGKLEPGQRVLLVEDLISTGGSAISSIRRVREAGGVLDNCLAIFTYEFKESARNFDDIKCRLITLSDFSTLVKVASEMGHISKGDMSQVLQWSKDPKNWKPGK
jgi:orotate phosphoribosyltransferase